MAEKWELPHPNPTFPGENEIKLCRLFGRRHRSNRCECRRTGNRVLSRSKGNVLNAHFWKFRDSGPSIFHGVFWPGQVGQVAGSKLTH